MPIVQSIGWVRIGFRSEGIMGGGEQALEDLPLSLDGRVRTVARFHIVSDQVLPKIVIDDVAPIFLKELDVALRSG